MLSSPDAFTHACGLASAALPTFFDLALKSVAILVVTALLARVLSFRGRGASAATRHLVWFLGVASLLVLPILSAALPAWRILPHAAPGIPHAGPEPAAPAAGEGPGALEVEGSEWWVERSESDPLPAPPSTYVSPPSTHHSLPAPPTHNPLLSTHYPPPSTPVPLVLLTLYALGVLLCLLPLALGSLSLLRLRRRATVVTAGPLRAELDACCARLGLRRRILLLQARPGARAMPMTWGALPFLPAKLLLPSNASPSPKAVGLKPHCPPESSHSAPWSPDRLRVVLLHELAHIQRRDCATQLVTQIVCALYWFNPIAWLAARRMLLERERACDDRVLTVNASGLPGVKSSDYADHLLQIAASLESNLFTRYTAIAMARTSALEGRVLAILDTRRNRRRVTAAVFASAVFLVASVVTPLAMLQARQTEPEPAPEKEAAETLEPGAIRVLLPDGSPAAGARMFIKPARESGRVVVRDGRVVRAHDFAEHRVDDRGVLALPSPQAREIRNVVIIHEQGYMAFATSDWVGGAPLRLRNWGRVEGVVLEGETPLAGRKVEIERAVIDEDERGLAFEIETRTDAQGRFTLEKLPVGRLPIKQGSATEWDPRRSQLVEVRAGETAQARIGGSGRMVVGRLVAPTTPNVKWLGLWCSAKEGYRGISHFSANVSVRAKPDEAGRFTLPDVPPGEYELVADAQRGDDAEARLAFQRPRVTVPAGEGVFDLGEIRLKDWRREEDYTDRNASFAAGVVRISAEQALRPAVVRLPQGGEVALLALGRIEESGAAWWLPDGTATDAVELGDRTAVPVGITLAVFRSAALTALPIQERKAYFLDGSSMVPFHRFGRVGDSDLFLGVVDHPAGWRYGKLWIECKTSPGAEVQWDRLSFRNVAMQAGVPAAVDASLLEWAPAVEHGPILPGSLVADLPSGVVVELLGLARLDGDEIKSWDVHGKPVVLPEVLPADLEGLDTVVAYHVRPPAGTEPHAHWGVFTVRDGQRVRLTRSATVSHGYLRLQSLEDKVGRADDNIWLTVTGGVWRDLWTVPPAADGGEQVIGRDGVESIKGPVANDQGGSTVTTKHAWDESGYEVFLKDRTGQFIEHRGRSAWRYRMEDSFPIAPEEVAGITLRHQRTATVRFTGLPLSPETKGSPRVAVEAVADAGEVRPGMEEEPAKPQAAADGAARRDVRLVVGPERLTLDGEDVALEQLSDRLAKVEGRGDTVLAVAATPDVTVTRWMEVKARAGQLVQELGFKYLSEVGIEAQEPKGEQPTPPADAAAKRAQIKTQLAELDREIKQLKQQGVPEAHRRRRELEAQAQLLRATDRELQTQMEGRSSLARRAGRTFSRRSTWRATWCKGRRSGKAKRWCCRWMGRMRT